MSTRRAVFHPESNMGQGAPGAGARPAGVPPQPVVLEPEEDVMPVAVTGPPRVGPAARVAMGGAPVPAPAARPAPGPSAAPASGGAPPEEAAPRIRAMDQRLGGGGSRHEDSWKRSPNLTGQGAIHCKSFHCKLTGDSLENLDRQVNEWLDAHPQYEVKFVTATVGEWLGKLREPNLILQVWV